MTSDPSVVLYSMKLGYSLLLRCYLYSGRADYTFVGFYRQVTSSVEAHASLLYLSFYCMMLSSRGVGRRSLMDKRVVETICGLFPGHVMATT